MTSGSVTPLLRREVPRSSSDAVTLSRRDDVLDPLSRRGRVHTATGVPVYNRVSTAAAAPLISTSVGCAVAVSLWHRCGITRRWRCRTYCSNRSIFMITEGVVCPWQYRYVLGLARDVAAKGCRAHATLGAHATSGAHATFGAHATHYQVNSLRQWVNSPHVGVTQAPPWVNSLVG